MRVRLLDRQLDVRPDTTVPPNADDLATDLDLEMVWAGMADGDRFVFDVARAVMLSSLDDPGAITYRQDVLADFRAHPGLARALYELATSAVAGEKRIFGFLRPTPSGVLRRAVEVLELCVGHLRQLRTLFEEQGADLASEGMRALATTVAQDLDDVFFSEVARHLGRLRFRGGVWISARLGEGNRGTRHVLRVPSEGRRRWKERVGLAAPTAYSFAIHPRDEAGLRALADLTDRGVDLAANAVAQSADHVLSFFTQLRLEAAFFLGCCNLEDQLSARGQRVCVPVPVPAERAVLSARGLCDASLVLRTGRPPMGNDLEADGRALVVVTGANSGGKSTFLRSVGVAQLMAQSGMAVCAESYRSSVSTVLGTHFPREEDPGMERGRFDDELARLSTLVDLLRPHGMLLCNESFASTNEWEGSEIGRQVVHALVESGVRLLLVTHLYDLAQSLFSEEDPAFLFLRAERREDGTRTFRIEEGAPLPTSYGVDLYERLGGW